MIAGQTHMWFGVGEDALAALDEYPNGVVVEIHERGGPTGAGLDVAWALTDDALTLARWLQSGAARIVNPIAP